MAVSTRKAYGFVLTLFFIGCVFFLIQQLKVSPPAFIARHFPILQVNSDNLVDVEWVIQRQKLLSQPGRPTKVLLMTYMRGGSTFLGELFNQNTHAIYWYEVAASFYAGNFVFPIRAFPMHITYLSNGKRREVSSEEKDGLSQFFQALYSCDFDNVPTATLTHNFLKRSLNTSSFMKCIGKGNSLGMSCNSRSPLSKRCNPDHNNDCIRNITVARRCLKDNLKTGVCSVKENPDLEPFLEHEQCYKDVEPYIKKCLPILRDTCEKSQIHSAKVHRVTMETLETLIKEMPDIHIIYYTRDPRGALSSRAKLHTLWGPAKGSLGYAAKYFCPKILHDMKVSEQYQAKYPGSVMRLSYENLAANPMFYMEKVYSYIGRDIPENVSNFLKDATNSRKDAGSWGTNRANSTATSLKWKDKLSPEVLEEIDSVCGEVYTEQIKIW